MADPNALNVEVITAVGAGIVLDPNKGVSIISGATASLCTLAAPAFHGQEKIIVFTTFVAHTVTPNVGPAATGASLLAGDNTVITGASTASGIGSVQLIYINDTLGWTIVGRASTADALDEAVLLCPIVG